MGLYNDFDDLKLQTELKSLIESSNIDINYSYTDTFYEDVIELLKNFEEEQKVSLINPEENKLEGDVKQKNQHEKTFQRERYTPKYKKFNKDKHKKVYKDEYEADRDFKLNIYKKNLFATPYFQEKKRRNAFNFNKSKPKDKSAWKKKGKLHQK